jgi:predicted permease
MMLLEHGLRDLAAAARTLARTKGFTCAAVLTLALGMTGSTVVFTLVEGVLLRPLPVRDQGRLLVAWQEFPKGAVAHWPFSATDIDVVRRESRLFERVSGVSYYGAGSGTVFEDGAPFTLRAASVAGGFFDVLGVTPVLGRSLAEADDVPGAENVLVITHALWQQRYGGSPGVLGRRVVIGETPFRIVGVMPADFAYPPGVGAWLTIAADAAKETNEAFREGILRDVDLVARLRPGATVDDARRELQAFVARLEEGASAGAPRGLRPVVRTFHDVVSGDVRKPILVLFAAVGLVLLTAAANVANLLLLRGEARRPELAVRTALGASRGRLVWPLVAESVVLALGAGLLSLVAAWWLLEAVVAFVPGGLPRTESIRVDPVVVAFTFGVSALVALLAGAAPALLSMRLDPAGELHGTRRAGGGPGVRRGRRALVVAQVALAVVVVAGAGLLVRSLLHLRAVDMGLAATRLVFVELAPTAARRPAPARSGLQLRADLVAQLESVPGIEAATPVNTLPFAGTGGWDLPVFTAEGQGPDEVERNPALNLEAVHPNYFSTLVVPLVRGRAFGEDDRSGAPEVAIVSEDVARRTWPAQDPIGKRIKFGRPDSRESWRTVVGVAGRTRYRELREARPTLYLPAAQFTIGPPILLVRTRLALDSVAALARTRVQAVDANLDVVRVAAFSTLLEKPLARPRFDATVIAAFGVAALLLAAVGLYAVMATYVVQRHPEIGIRVALGATAFDVRRLVLGETMRVTAIGVAIGLATAAVSARMLRGLLYGVGLLDPVSLGAAVLLLVGASALAGFLPARRATRVDPVVVLRAG